MKDLRDDIVHEYETDDLRSVFRQTLDATPELFRLAEKTQESAWASIPPNRGEHSFPGDRGVLALELFDLAAQGIHHVHQGA